MSGSGAVTWWREMRWRDRIAVAAIWSLVIAGAFLLAPRFTDDSGGIGREAAIVGMALTGLYFYLRNLRYRGTLMRTPADPGSATAGWLKVVLVIVLWIAGSVIAIVAGIDDALAMFLGGLLPLAVFLVRRFRH
jgi:hypothetical protein